MLSKPFMKSDLGDRPGELDRCDPVVNMAEGSMTRWKLLLNLVLHPRPGQTEVYYKTDDAHLGLYGTLQT